MRNKKSSSENAAFADAEPSADVRLNKDAVLKIKGYIALQEQLALKKAEVSESGEKIAAELGMKKKQLDALIPFLTEKDPDQEVKKAESVLGFTIRFHQIESGQFDA